MSACARIQQLCLIRSPRSVDLLMIYSGKVEKLAGLSAAARWHSGQRLINTFTGTVQLRLEERQGVSADQAHVELKAEDGPAAAPRAVFIIAHHLKSKKKPLVCVRQH